MLARSRAVAMKALLHEPKSEAEPALVFYDAEEPNTEAGLEKLQLRRQAVVARIHRVNTDFPEDQEPSETVGPWRTTQVECRGNPNPSTWLLVGRRHSVDERRDAMEQSKLLFLRSLGAKADGVWRGHTAARAEELQASEDRIHDQLQRQAQALRSAYAFWAQRHASDSEYLARLEACASTLGNQCSSNVGRNGTELLRGQAQQETWWRQGIQNAAEDSAAWMEQLPRLIDSHDRAAGEVRKAVARASAEAQAACSLVRAAKAQVWPPAAAGAMDKLPGAHGSDIGPDSGCLWLATRSYLAACGGMQAAQTAALCRARREEQTVSHLGQWVDAALDCSSAGGRWQLPLTTVPAPSRESAKAEAPESPTQPEEESHEQAESCCWGSESCNETETSDDDDDRPLDLSTDISALVVHEQEVDVQSGAQLDPTAWVPSQLLLSLDLWLHVWTPRALATDSGPGRSIALPRDCLRPVAERVADQSNILRLLERPRIISTRLFDRLAGWLQAPDGKACGDLWIRCANEKDCNGLLGALELVERMYPTIE
mmetsp:Transcript_35694/g.70653  ORF Transcript_35694/g.70653 Transcript_35694/m.70653 type:complete len:543 (+) Transcript_35694:89-1717(+)